MNKKLFRNILNQIKKHDDIVIARHIGPDPDAVSSQNALKDSIKLTFPNKNVYVVGRPVSKFKYLGEMDKVDESTLEDPLLIVVDLPNFNRIDGVTLDYYKNVIKIDHHPFEMKMGKYEYIDVNATSAAELVLDVIENTNLKMNKEIAEKIFVGLVSDSDRFLIPSTNAETFKRASILLNKYNIDLSKCYSNLYLKPFNEVKFEGYISNNMTITENKLGYIKISKDVIKEYKVDTSTASNLINNFNHINEILVWTFSTYDKERDEYKINIRSRGPVINTVAKKFNGGGHKFASGAKLKNETEIDELFKALDETCKEYNEKS